MPDKSEPQKSADVPEDFTEMAALTDSVYVFEDGWLQTVTNNSFHSFTYLNVLETLQHDPLECRRCARSDWQKA